MVVEEDSEYTLKPTKLNKKYEFIREIQILSNLQNIKYGIDSAQLQKYGSNENLSWQFVQR